MSREAADAAPEREKTDESLRIERENTDAALELKQKESSRHADDVVHLARDTADAVLKDARDNADQVLEAARETADDLQDAAGQQAASRASLIEERQIADDVLHEERLVADETLREERSEYARSLDQFLPVEREATDRNLSSERMRSDTSLENRDDFLAMVTHDLRDLMSGIVMSNKLVSRAAAQDGDRKVFVTESARISRYTTRMNRLIGDLVDMTSIEAGKLAVHAGTSDAVALIAEVTEAFRAPAAAREVSLETQTSAPALKAEFDHDRVLQVLANLMSNALKFTERSGRIVIRAECVGEELLISVTDTGCGVSTDALGRIFDRFSQVGPKDHRGLGLGLYISRCIVEAHGGRIEARSTLGKGTTVSLALPLRRP